MLNPSKLLVSVKNIEEAKTALEAGVDLIDIKDPAMGSLGKADEHTIRGVCNILTGADVSVSAALGELADWKAEYSEQLPENLSYLKLGLAGMRDRSGWEELWQNAQAIIQAHSPHLVAKWIAVAYVDTNLAHAPAVEDVVEAAHRLGCHGVLFDTYHKSTQRFFDWMTFSQLQNHIHTIQQQNMLCAVAGQLRLEDVMRLSTSAADIIAVRSAACEENNRKAEISSTAIGKLIQTIQSTQHAQ